MRYKIAGLIGVLALAGLAGVAAAAPRYVSDQLSINMRRGPGTDYRISRLLDAGARLETLSAANGWSRVRTGDGETGYVLTRLLSERPAARARMAAIKQKNQKLKAASAGLEKKLAESRQDLKQVGRPKQKLVAENRSLKARLRQIKEISADAIRIGKENQKYRERLIALRDRVAGLRHENAMLNSRRVGIKIGALILFAGLIVGLLSSLLRRRRANGWGSL